VEFVNLSTEESNICQTAQQRRGLKHIAHIAMPVSNSRILCSGSNCAFPRVSRIIIKKIWLQRLPLTSENHTSQP
jgi:hypothetical protein